MQRAIDGSVIRIAGTFFDGKIFSEKVKKALKFFFNLKGRACVQACMRWKVGD